MAVSLANLTHLIKAGKLCCIDNCVACYVGGDASPQACDPFFPARGALSHSVMNSFKVSRNFGPEEPMSTCSELQRQYIVLAVQTSWDLPGNDAVGLDRIGVLLWCALWQFTLRLHANLHLERMSSLPVVIIG